VHKITWCQTHLNIPTRDITTLTHATVHPNTGLPVAVDKGAALEAFAALPGAGRDGGRYQRRYSQYSGRLPSSDTQQRLLGWICAQLLIKGRCHASSAAIEFELQAAKRLLSPSSDGEARKHMPETYRDMLSLMAALGCAVPPMVAYEACNCGYVYRNARCGQIRRAWYHVVNVDGSAPGTSAQPDPPPLRLAHAHIV
jgi:hypothetical protein